MFTFLFLPGSSGDGKSQFCSTLQMSHIDLFIFDITWFLVFYIVRNFCYVLDSISFITGITVNTLFEQLLVIVFETTNKFYIYIYMCMYIHVCVCTHNCVYMYIDIHIYVYISLGE